MSALKIADRRKTSSKQQIGTKTCISRMPGSCWLGQLTEFLTRFIPLVPGRDCGWQSPAGSCWSRRKMCVSSVSPTAGPHGEGRFGCPQKLGPFLLQNLTGLGEFLKNITTKSQQWQIRTMREIRTQTVGLRMQKMQPHIPCGEAVHPSNNNALSIKPWAGPVDTAEDVRRSAWSSQSDGGTCSCTVWQPRRGSVSPQSGESDAAWRRNKEEAVVF